MKNKTLLILFAISLPVLFMLSISYAGTIIIKPGKFDHFTLQLPERIVAGESFIIKVQTYDAHNNPITNFLESGKEFKIVLTGSANVQPSELGPSSFSGGVANINATDKKAETIVFSIYEGGGSVPVISREIVVSPNKLDHFVIDAPTNVMAGNGFEARIIAKDAFDNTVSDTEMINKNINITSSGKSSLKVIQASLLNFKNSTATVSLIAEKTGNVSIEVQEGSTGSKGRSQDIIINAAALSYFKLQAPKEATAGEPFDITVAAYDTYGNPFNYASNGNGVVLQSTGRSMIEPSFIKPSDFKNNEAVIKVVYEKAEEINIIAKEHNNNQEGKSNLMKVGPTVADHFVVITPEEAVSGLSFKIKVEAYDRYDNLVKNYNLTGSNVMLQTTGNGFLLPSIVSPSEFIDGVASVEVMYDKAESFSISAVMASVKTTERIVMKKQEPIKKPVEPAQAPKKIEKKKKTETKKKAATQKTVIKETKIEKPDKEFKKELKQPFTVDNISIIEAKEKVMLIIKVTPSDGQFEYIEGIESRSNKEWLKIRLKPAIRKIERALKFESEFIGEVIIEEDKSEQYVLNIYVELMPAEVTFDVANVKNSLIVTVARP